MKRNRGAHKDLIKSLSLTGGALLVVFFSNSALWFAVVVALASVVGFRDLLRLIAYPRTIRFSSVLAVSILLAYGLGSGIYLVAHATLDATRYQYFDNYGLWFDQPSLSMALAISLVASAILYVRSTFERPLCPFKDLQSMSEEKSIRLVWLGVALASAALYTGEIGYMGAFVREDFTVTPLGALAVLIVPPLVPYCLLLVTGQCSRGKKAALFVAMIFLAGILFLLGRRYLLYVAVLSAIAFHMRGYRVTQRGVLIVFAFLACSALIVYWGFYFFMALRLAVSEFGKDASLLDISREALSRLSGAEMAIVQEKLAENVSSRPFVLSYLAGLVGINSTQMPAFGEELLYSLQMAVPSVLMPGKMSALPPSAEDLLHPRYGIPIFDGPNSLLVAGFDDFGFLGAVTYPLGAAWLYFWAYRILRSMVRDSAIRLFVFFGLVFQLFYIEEELSAIFVALRNLVIVIGVAWGIMRFPRLRLALRSKVDARNGCPR